MERIRTFIAIELAEALHRRLGQLLAQLQREVDVPVRWVRPEMAHLTLKFLGEVASSDTEAIAAAMARGATQVAPFFITLGGVGGFPSLERPRVLWVGVGGDLDALARLQRLVDGELQALGYPAEERPFQPHLTLGRLRQARPLRLGSPGGTPAPQQRVERVSLMKSDLKPTGAVYTRLVSALLKNGLSAL